MANPFDRFDSASSGNPFDQFDAPAPAPAPKADPKIGQPEELTFAEKYLAPVLEKVGLGEQGAAGKLGVSRSGAVGRAAMGAADPGMAVVQIAANAVGKGDVVNKRIQEVERQYQAGRGEDADTFDPLRAAGATGISLMVPGAMAAGAGIVRGAATGAGFGALDTVKDGGENFWTDKAKQVGIGAAGGAVMSPLLGAIARVVSPKASTNAELAMLREADINPSIGQALGGWANTAEEKLMSAPILGDAIASMRRNAHKDFNRAVLDAAVGPVGGKASAVGTEGVAAAGNTLRGAYNKAAADAGTVSLEGTSFASRFGDLQGLESKLHPDLRDRFRDVLENEVLRRMSPDGSIAGNQIKKVDSELGRIAAEWRKSSSQSEKELGSAVRAVQQAFRDGLAEANPAYATAREAADQGWRAFRLARNATASAKNKEGVFTPAQFNSAVQADAGKAAMGEGRAFMQDEGMAAQNVLGNKYPDSGSIGRLLLNGAFLPVHYGTAGATVAGLGLGAAAYARPVQNALVAMIANRPDKAPAVANYLRKLVRPATAAALPWLPETD